MLNLLIATATGVADNGENVQGHMTFGKDFFYQSAGMIVVMLSLSFLAITVTLIAKFFFVKPSAQPTPKPEQLATAMPSAPAAVVPAAAVGTIAPEIQAVIAAAVHTACTGGVRIVAMNPEQSAARQSWASEGRRSIFQSRPVR